jgi:ssDNA-binding replication factor A large subunit
MLGLKYEDIVAKIVQEKGLNELEVKSRIEGKLKQLSGLISKEGAAHIVATELGLKLFSGFTRDIKIKDIVSGLGNVNINGKVVDIKEVREYNKNGRSGKVANFMIGDETGVIRVTLWDSNHIKLIEDGKIKIGDIVRVKSAYSKENNGFKEIHLGNRGEITVNPANVQVGEVVRRFGGGEPNFVGKKISELQAGDVNVSLIGTIVQVFEPKFYNTCTQCGKKASLQEDKYVCAEHGIVPVEEAPVLNIYFDDGTDSIRAVAFKDQVKKLLENDNLNDIKVHFNEIKNNILGKQVKLVGRVNKNEMQGRNEFVIQRVLEFNPGDIAQELLAK